jgi:hypothetical protein
MRRRLHILIEKLPEETDGKNYFASKNIQVIAEGILVNFFTVGAMHAFYNHK